MSNFFSDIFIIREMANYNREQKNKSREKLNDERESLNNEEKNANVKNTAKEYKSEDGGENL